MMNLEIESKNVKTTWFIKNKLSDEERKKLIDEKVEKLYNQMKFDQRVREIIRGR